MSKIFSHNIEDSFVPDIQDKLKALLANKGVMTGQEWRKAAEEHARQRAEGVFEIDKTVPGRLVGDSEEGFYLVQTDYPLDTPHGPHALGEALDAAPSHIAFSACDEELEDYDPATAMFVDTETTGLAGGTGTMAFLVGVGYFVEDAFRLDQCFMRDYDDEPAMLEYLAELFHRCGTVVTYNGKSFDVPLLRTRFIQNRIPFRLDSVPHLDLVHAARRFWKMRLQDCSLTNIERQALGIERQDDVNSAEIPQLWLDYLRTRDARPLERVFYHHRMDILSLVALTASLSRNLAGAAEMGFEHAEDQYSLVRLHFRHRQYVEVMAQGRRLLESEAEPMVRRECLELMGLAGKRLQDWEAMEKIWSLLLDEFPENLVARHELAKHHEHRTRNLFEAERLCAQAVEFIETRIALGNSGALEDSHLRTFQRRLERLRKKLGRSPGLMDE